MSSCKGEKMNTEELQRSIEEADNHSLRIGAANRVVQLLQKLRYSNNENSSKRWVWELCQNAKDICNDTGRVKIAINFDKANKKVIFKHNGKAFSMANAMSLINQTSSKDRNDGSERKSGKFGTGFLTTHLLSEVVNLSGILETKDGVYSYFHFTLDRRGHEQEEIIEAMERAVQQLMECTPLQGEPDWDTYNTVFEYELDDDGMEVAEQGIQNLRVSAPYVLSILKDIEEITLETTREVFRYQKNNTILEHLIAHEILYKLKDEEKTISILNLTEGEVTISAILEHINTLACFVPFAEGQSKLFCDFPLIGTEDFPFPVVISSSTFNPTEPRDGIYLACKSKNKIDPEIEQNRDIIEKACRLYEKLLQYAAKHNWNGIYHITHIKSYTKKEWYDEEWIKEIINKCKQIILNTEMIMTAAGKMTALQDCFEEEQVYVISDVSGEVREKIWELLYPIMPECIPCREDLNNWYHSLWNDCNRYTFRALSKQLQDYGTIERLQEVISGKSWKNWLLQYYSVIEKDKSLQEYMTTNKIRIIPNQKGVFHYVTELHFDRDIIDEYKDILSILETDCRSWLVHQELSKREWFQAKEVDNGHMLRLMEEKLETAERESKSSILFQMVYFYEKNGERLEQQKRICEYAVDILDIDASMREVPLVSQKILQEALKYTITCVADRISEYGCMEGLARYLGKLMESVIDFMVEFIDFIVRAGYGYLIEKSTKPILPNQNGKFVSKDDIFLDNEMDETLKELVVSAGYDIKAELLEKRIYLKLPENREKKDSDIASVITQYVNSNRTSKEEKIRMNFKKLLLWMTDNSEKAMEIFPELHKHKHYLYDDEEITSNIRKAEAFENIMEKYTISSTEKLEEIIRKGQSSDLVARDERSEITPEVLLQYGIDSEAALENAFADNNFAERYYTPAKHDSKTYEYVKSILERSRNNIFSYLKTREEYDLTDMYQASDTIFVIKKNEKEIYLLARPSDGGEVCIYYRAEKDLLDYSMDWELWVEDNYSEPQKLTFGKVIKLTGLNRIPLRGM